MINKQVSSFEKAISRKFAKSCKLRMYRGFPQFFLLTAMKVGVIFKRPAGRNTFSPPIGRLYPGKTKRLIAVDGTESMRSDVTERWIAELS